jgi:hypothetical protein
MGDYADMAVDEGIGEGYWELGRDPADVDFYDANDGQPSARVFRLLGPRSKTCNRCGQGGLWWQQTERGWRLHSAERSADGQDYAFRPHTCVATAKDGTTERSALPREGVKNHD